MEIYSRACSSLRRSLESSCQEYEVPPETCCQHEVHLRRIHYHSHTVEACLNSRPLTPLSCDSDSVKALTPGHFLIGKPIESLPDTSFSYRALPLLRRWHLCQSIVRHFWQRWSAEYVTSLRRLTKWQHPTRNFQVGDIVVLQEDNLVPTKWPLALVMKVHVGNDKLVRVVTVKTSTGTYKRPTNKMALLLPTTLSM